MSAISVRLSCGFFVPVVYNYGRVARRPDVPSGRSTAAWHTATVDSRQKVVRTPLQPTFSGNNPGIHRDASVAGNVSRSVARGLSDSSTPHSSKAATMRRA